MTRWLADQIGTNDLQSAVYADRWLRCLDPSLPMPELPFYRRPVSPRGYSRIEDVGLWLPLSCVVTIVQVAFLESGGTHGNQVGAGQGWVAATAGNLLVAALAVNGDYTITGITDSASQTWVQAAAANATWTGNVTDVWYFANTASGATNITNNFTNFQNVTMVCYEVSGIVTSSPQDGNGAVLSSQSSANPSLPTITTSTLGFIVTNCLEQHAISGGGAAGFTANYVENAVGSGTSSRTTSAAGTYGPEVFTATAGSWCGSTVAFKGTGGGGGTFLPIVPSLPMLGMQ